MKSSFEDYNRITKEFNLSEFENRLNNCNDYSAYGIILGDVWTENNFKTKIYNDFENIFLKDEASHFKSNVSSNIECINDHYKLLGSYFIIKK